MAYKMTPQEVAYFAQLEEERTEKIKEEKKKRIAKEERENAQKLHFMKCPKCGMNLIEIDFKGVKLDECSSCHGIWFDQGELRALVKVELPILSKMLLTFAKKRR